ncbi:MULTISPECIES: winged helix-turn-helix transcriptional regulator [Holzapfeliella]
MCNKTLQTTENEILCHCFIESFEFLGKKWNGLIICALCKNEAMRFKDLANIVQKCSDRVLTERLKELESLKIVDRSVDEQTGVIRYSLTQKGDELKPVMDQIHAWGKRWHEEEN